MNHFKNPLRKLHYLLICLCISASVLTANTSYAADQQGTASLSETTGKVNINAADATLLSKTLKGVGLKKAQAIVEYRKTYGPFHNIQELAEVSGIGNSILEKNAGLISVE